MNERLAAFGRRRLFERYDAPFLVASDFEDGMQDRADGRAKMMKVLEQAVDDERAICSHRLDDGERVVVVVVTWD